MKNKKLAKLASAIVLTLTLICLAAPVALAAEGGNVTKAKGLDVETVIGNAINWALGIVSLVAVIMIIYAGFLWVTSEGGENAVRARKMMTAAIIGIVIAFLAYAIVKIVMGTFLGVTTTMILTGAIV